MKSMLHEASSVTKAIEKAWADAGKPTEFAIKVLESGEKNFLGLSKRPAIVSITYEPRKQGGGQQGSSRSQERSRGGVYLRPTSGGQSQPKQAHTQSNTQLKDKPLQRQLPNKKNDTPVVQPKPAPMPMRPIQPQQQKPVKEVAKTLEQPELLVWQDEWVAFVAKDLKELLALWGSASAFSTKIDKKNLTITLEEHLHADAMEERNVFMAFSYVLVQFLKRNYKKKFRGFQLILMVKKTVL